MLGSSNSLRALERARFLCAAIALLILMAILAPAAAHASGCTNTWTNTKGGSWFEGANWSKKTVPTSGEEACITEPGSYVITMTQTSTTGTVTLKSLTVGASSGTQTLMVGSSGSLNAILTTTAGISTGAHGVLTMVNGDAAGNNVTLVGPIANAGLFAAELVHGGTATLEGSFTNTGSLSIFTPTSFKGANTLTNEGTLNVAEGETLTVSSKEGSVTNGTGGKIIATGTGTGDVLLSGGKFTEGAGTTSGSKPVIVDDGSTSYTGAGASTIALHGEGTLSGTSSSGQTLSIESTGGENALTKVTSGFVNGGAITLTNGDAAGNSAELAVTGGTLTNSGTLTSELAHGGSRTLQGNITNTGTITINTNTSFNGAKGALANQGAVNLASGVQLIASNESSFTNGAGGKIVATGSGDVLMEPATTFTEGAGTTSGSKPVIVRDGALAYTGAGASAIAIHGSSTLSGSLASGQSLSIESTGGENADATAAAGFTNAGSITLTNGDAAGNSAELAVTAGTLTNSGTIAVEQANGGSRTLQGSITNTGSIAINANTSYSGAKYLLTNEGTLSLAEAKQLTVSGENAVSNLTGGKILATGSGLVQLEPGGAFTEGAGTTSGTKPVVIRDGSLTYTGTGVSTIAEHGSSTLTGNIGKGQVLLIESTGGENAIVTAAAALLNSGTITLTNGDAAGNNATLNLAGATLTNAGTIDIEEDHGGGRTIEGSITSEKTLLVSAGATLKLTGSYTQGKKGTLEIGINSASSFGILSASGPASINGTLSLVVAKTFKGSLAQKYGILSSSALTGTFAKEKKVAISKSSPEGLYYKPVYSGTGVTLQVVGITLTPTPTEGAASSTVILAGEGYPAEDTVTLTFTDHAKHKTTLPSVKTSAAGTFSTEITVPAGAAEGAATFEAKSKDTTAKIKATFKVI